jgi:hypothetical protein
MSVNTGRVLCQLHDSGLLFGQLVRILAVSHQTESRISCGFGPILDSFVPVMKAISQINVYCQTFKLIDPSNFNNVKIADYICGNRVHFVYSRILIRSPSRMCLPYYVLMINFNLTPAAE